MLLQLPTSIQERERVRKVIFPWPSRRTGGSLLSLSPSCFLNALAPAHVPDVRWHRRRTVRSSTCDKNCPDQISLSHTSTHFPLFTSKRQHVNIQDLLSFSSPNFWTVSFFIYYSRMKEIHRLDTSSVASGTVSLFRVPCSLKRKEKTFLNNIILFLFSFFFWLMVRLLVNPSTSRDSLD